MAGLTDQGFTIKRLAEIIENLKDNAQIQFGDLVAEGDVVNTGDNSVLGRYIGLNAPALADLWEAVQQAYNARSIYAATGVALDELVALGGVFRKSAAATTATLLLEGTYNTAIPVNSQVKSEATGKLFTILEAPIITNTASSGVTLEVGTVANSTVYSVSFKKVPDSLSEGTTTISITSDSSATATEIKTALQAAMNPTYAASITASINSDGKLVVTPTDEFQKMDFTVSTNLLIEKCKTLTFCACTETGPVEQPENTIKKIATPVFGWDSVTNPSQAVVGNDRETDDELRNRYNSSKFVDGVNTVEALYSALLAIDGVTKVAIYENDTDTAFSLPQPPVPPHSFYPIVQGGNTDLIAKAIWNNKPAGILSWGNTTVNIQDSQGISHEISFERPAAADVYVRVVISTLVDFEPDGVQQIKDAVVAYITANYSIGEDIIYSRLYTPINSVSGHYVNSLGLGTSPSPSGTSNLTIAFNEIPVCTANNVEVVII